MRRGKSPYAHERPLVLAIHFLGLSLVRLDGHMAIFASKRCGMLAVREEPYKNQHDLRPQGYTTSFPNL